MQQPVDQIKMGRGKYGYKQQPENEYQWVFRYGKYWNDSISQGPQVTRFVDRPNRSSTSQRPKNIVPQLAAEREFTTLLEFLASQVLEPLSLTSVSEKVEMEPSRYQYHEYVVADEYRYGPTQRKRSRNGQVRQ